MIFQYKPRTSTQIERRAHQSHLGDWKAALESAREAKPTTVVSAPVAPLVKVEPEQDDALVARKAKKGSRTPCIDCGHGQCDHHMNPAGHQLQGEWLFYCVTRHCCARVLNPDRTFSDCACLHFRATPETVPELTRPTVDEWTPCASCGHWRSKHCTKRKIIPGKPLSNVDWKGLEDENNLPVPCSHTLPDPKPYACDSSACATVLGDGEAEHFCDCKKFASPYLKKKPVKQPKIKSLIPIADLERAHQNYLAEHSPQPKTKEALLLEVAAECPDLTALTAKEIGEITGMSPAWVRKHLKAIGITLAKPPRKKAAQSAFVTGEPLQVNP